MEQPKWWHCEPPTVEDADDDSWTCECGVAWTLHGPTRTWHPEDAPRIEPAPQPEDE